jgi:hypothetical protein
MSAESVSPTKLGLDGIAAVRRSRLVLPTELPLLKWEQIGRQLSLISDSSAWWLGDWLVYGQRAYRTRYRDVVKRTGLDYQTLRNYAWVARSVECGRRRDKLSFQHHAEVASLPVEQQDHWLAQAERNGWSRNELRRQLRAGRISPADPVSMVHVQMAIGPDQARRWEEAAHQDGCELHEWIIGVLDRAAHSIQRMLPIQRVPST